MAKKKIASPATRRIKAEIVLRGLTIPEIAQKIGVTRSWLSQVINGHVKSARVRKRLSDVLGLPLSIWEELDREVSQ